jgi:hypothetical protein
MQVKEVTGLKQSPR